MKDFLLPFILISIPLLGFILTKLKIIDENNHEVDSLDYEETFSSKDEFSSEDKQDNHFLSVHEQLKEKESIKEEEDSVMEKDLELSLKSYVADNKESISDLIDFIKHQGIYRFHEDYIAFPNYAIYELCFSKIDTSFNPIAPASLRAWGNRKQVLEIKVEITHPDSLKVFEIITYNKKDDMDYKKEYSQSWNLLSDATEYLFNYLRR